MDPDQLVHYLAACAAAHVSPANLASTFNGADDMRAFTARVSKLAIPDAVRAIKERLACRMSDLRVVRNVGEGDRALGFAEATHRTTGIMAGGWGENLEYLRGVEAVLAETINRVREAIGHAETLAAQREEREHDDAMHWILDALEDHGGMTRRELHALNRNHDACNRYTDTAIGNALDRAVGLCLVIEDDKTPPSYRLGKES